MLRKLELDGRSITVYPSSVSNLPVVYLNMYLPIGDEVYESFKAGIDTPFNLVVIAGLEWDRDMAPWDAPPISREDTPCVGGALGYLKLLVEKIIPQSEEYIQGTPVYRVLAGYSLAGLFALYAMYKCDSFKRIASMSGSLWFPKIIDYMRDHAPQEGIERVYLSLGDREHITRNPYLKTVKENTVAAVDILKTKGISVFYESNKGGHHNDPIERMVKGVRYILQ